MPFVFIFNSFFNKSKMDKLFYVQNQNCKIKLETKNNGFLF